MLSLTEIAERIKCSPATVSRALNPEKRHLVKAETLKRILAFCEQNEYYAHLAARTLKSGKSYSVGLILGNISADFASPTFALVVNAIVMELKKHNYSLKIIPVDYDSPDIMDRSVLKALHGSEVDGFILGEALLREKTFGELCRNSVPVTVLSLHKHSELPFNTVINDDLAAIAAMTDDWVRLGISEIAVLGGYIDTTPRVDAVQRCCAERKIGVSCFALPDFDALSLQEALNIYCMVEDKWAQISRFRAFFCVDDLAATGARRVFARHGGGEMPLFFGYDNIEENPNFRTLRPEISTIAPDWSGIGRAAVELLFESAARGTVRRVAANYIPRFSGR